MPIGLEQWRAQIGALEAQRYRYLSRAARKAARGGRSRVCRVSGRGMRCWAGFAVGVTLLVLVVSFSLLLLRAGDVERNPGPLPDTLLKLLNRIDRKPLTEENIFDVYEEVIIVSGSWASMSMALRLLPSHMSAIAAAHPGNPKECLQDTLTMWLRQNYDVKKFGPPTWEMLVKAVASPAGGNNSALAIEIARRHQAAVASPPTPSSLQAVDSPGHTIHTTTPEKQPDPRETHYISSKFAETFEKISGVLDKSVSVRDLKKFLKFYTHPLYPEQRLFDPKIYKDAETTEEVLEELFPQFINYMNHFLLEDIIERFQCDEARRLLQEYTGQLPDYRKRKLSTFPDPITDDSEFDIDDALANKQFEEAMKQGEVRAQIAKCIFMGAAGAGKTNVIHLLLDLDPPPIRTSTDAVAKSRRVTCVKFATPSIAKPDEDPEIGEEDPDIWREITGEEMRRLLADAISKLMADEPVGARRESDTESTPHSSNVAVAQSSSIPEVEEDIVKPLADLNSKVKKDIVKLIRKVHGGGKLLEMKWIYIVDSGGQNEFLDILPAFIKNTSACVFVLKLSEDLEHYPDIEYHDESGKRGSYVSHLSNKDIFQSCMQTIQSLPCSDDCGTFPEVIIVGTHTDEEGEHQKVNRDAKNKQLCDILLPTPESNDDHIIFNRLHRKEVIFPVNATSRDPEDKAVAAKLLKQIKLSPQPLPLQWYGLELEIESMAEERRRGIISWKECEEAAHRMHFPGSNDHPNSHQIEFHKSLDAALKYLDKLNVILYYPKVLPNLVFSHPSVLLEKVSELVKKSFELRGERPAESCDPTAGEWSPFCDKGIITIKFLETFKSHYVKDFFEPHHLIELLDSLLITAKVSDTEHFMPCLLAKFPPDKLNSKDSDNGHATPFAIYFPKGHAPCGLFPAVVAYLCSSRNKMGAWKQTSRKLYRNHMTFSVSKPSIKVTLNDSLSFFEMHVSINGPSDLYKKHCPTIREAVWAGVKYAIDVRSFRDVDYEEAFLVCQCSAKSHPATVQYGDTPYWTCTKSEKWDELKEKEMVWYEQGVVNSLKRLHPQGADVQQPPPPKRPAIDTRYGSSSIHQPPPVGGYQQTSGPDVQQPPPPKRPAIHTQYASVHQPPPARVYQQTPDMGPELALLSPANTTGTPTSLPQESKRKPLNEKPRLAQLKLMRTASGEKIQIITTVATRWRDVGILLDFDPEGDKVAEIEANHSRSGVRACCQEMFRHWLAGGGRPATWVTLIEVLEDEDYTYLAGQVRLAL